MSKKNKKNKTYSRAFNLCADVPWAILHSKLVEIQAFLVRKSLDGSPFAFDQEMEIEAKGKPSSTVIGSVAVLPLFGTIAKRMDMMSAMSGGTSIENFTKSFNDAVSNPGVKAIVINIDSPGGSVFGVQELADTIMNARASKHIVGVANDMAASAAYWIASACDEVVMTPSGMVGSIGVYTMHQDMSEAYKQAGVNPTIIQAGKYKTEGNPFEPLGDEARASMQESVDFYYDAFIGAVAKGRGTTITDVKNNYGQGRVLNSKDAKAAGMVDRIDTLDGVLTRLGVSPNPTLPGARVERRVSHSLAERELALLENN